MEYARKIHGVRSIDDVRTEGMLDRVCGWIAHAEYLAIDGLNKKIRRAAGWLAARNKGE